MLAIRRLHPIKLATALGVGALLALLPARPLPVGPASLSAQPAVPITATDMSELRSREIGPAVTGGRITDLAVHDSDPRTIYVATAAGGIWKSSTGGVTWAPIFDDQPVSTFGDVEIAPSNPQILYAGTGEQNNRQSTSWGNGVYRSDDGGETWRHLGLEGTRHVGRILIHPTDPDVAYVAGLGNLWGENEERGVFRTRDGGASWDKVLYIDAYTGAVDLAMDPSDPDVVYAAMYQRLRKAWGFNGGGPGSGIWKTTDGGTSWGELTNGIPASDKGRIGIAVAPSDPNVLVALIEAPTPPSAQAAGAGGGGRGGGVGRGGGRGGGTPSGTGTYRSEDGGASWERVSSENGRPMYYSHIFIDPNDPNLVYTASTNSKKSEDGGRTWIGIESEPSYDVGVHLDMHAMWLDPNDREHFLLAGDGGLHETFDGGETYRKINSFNVAQFYAIDVDMRDPYYVYGGLQDNHSWFGPSETRRWAGILNDDWQQIGFSDGMYQQVDRAGPRYVYSSATSGSYVRVDAISGTKLSIGPEAPEGERYSFDWTSPGLASVHADGLFYMGGNRIFISRDFGETWDRTDELHRGEDVSDRPLMGVPLSDVYISRNDGVGSYGVVSTLAESPRDMNILWAGLDDGNLQVSRDQGATWTEVSGNVPGLPDGTYVSRVAASAFGDGIAYATFDGHRDGDFAPYVYRTTDFGASWIPLHDGLPTGSVNVIVEHPDNGNVLFLGTEHAPWVSTNGGADWARIPNLPTTAYDDMVFHPREKDLVMGTHGRGIWILDDTRMLAEWNRATTETPAHLFSIGRGTIFRYRKDTSYRAQAEYAGENPPDGVEITYRLGAGSGPAELVVARQNGTVIRRISVPTTAGVHRVNWDLRHGDPDEADEWSRWDNPDFARPPNQSSEPFVSPGRYTVTLEARGVQSSATVDVVGDPLLPLSPADYRATEEFLLRVRALSDRAQEAAGAEGLAPELRQRIQAVAQGARRLGSPYNGRFHDGAFDPPGPLIVERLRELEEELNRATGG